MGNPYDSLQADESLFIHFVTAHEVLVIAEVAEEPAEFPKGLGGAIEATSQETALLFAGLENGEAQDVEGSLRMSTVEDTIDADEESALQSVVSCTRISMQTWDMAFHEATSSDLA